MILGDGFPIVVAVIIVRSEAIRENILRLHSTNKSYKGTSHGLIRYCVKVELSLLHGLKEKECFLG